MPSTAALSSKELDPRVFQARGFGLADHATWLEIKAKARNIGSGAFFEYEDWLKSMRDRRYPV